MASILPQSSVLPVEWSLANLQDHLGGVSLKRIRLFPSPGTASERDLEEILDRENCACELIDGVLVEKSMGFFESRIAAILIFHLERFVQEHDLGIVLGEAGLLRILPDQVRAADVAFIGWEHFPDRKLPSEAVPSLVPDLAIEVLSKGNTKQEIERKLRDYFQAGVRLVWCIDPRRRTAEIYTAPDQSERMAEDGLLVGGSVLPDFQLSLRDLFAQAGRCE